MTARPLPEAVVLDVARLFAKRRQPAPTMDGAHNPNPAEVAAAREACEIFAAAMAPGEPVAWAVFADGASVPAYVSAIKDRADRVVDSPAGRDEDYRVVPLYAAPAEAAPVADHPQGGPEPEGRESVRDAIALPTRGDVGRPEATRDPIFLLQWRERNRPVRYNRWQVDSVWFTREEAEAFGKGHAHRWGTDKNGPCWQVYCVPANGDLAALLKIVTKRDAPKGGSDAR